MSIASVHLRATSWVLVLVLATTSVSVSAQCTNDTAFGFVPIDLSGAVKTFTTCSFAGEYSTATGAVNGQLLRFTSSVPTDFITVRSGTFDGPVVAFGPTPLGIGNTHTGPLFAHWSANATCGRQAICRTTTVQFIGECAFTRTFGSGTINADGTATTLSTCMFPGEYSTILGAVNGQTLSLTSNVATDYITVRRGSPNGPVVARGPTPLVFPNTETGALFAHWAANAMCGEASVCRVTTVQCTSCNGLIFRNGFE